MAAYDTKHAFGFSPLKNRLLMGEIIKSDDIMRLLHEVGHAWGSHFSLQCEGVDVARSRTMNPLQEAEKFGPEPTVEKILKILASERGANIIGKEFAGNHKIFELFGNVCTPEWQNKQELSYYDTYIKPLVDKYPRISQQVEIQIQKELIVIADIVQKLLAN